MLAVSPPLIGRAPVPPHRRPPSWRRVVVAAVATAAVAVASACGGSTAASTAPTSTAPPFAAGTAAPVGAKPKVATQAPNPLAGTSGSIAHVKASVTSVAVYPAEGAADPAGHLPNPWLYNNEPHAKIPRAFLVKQDKGDWLEVYAGEPPTGSTGWIKRADVDLIAARYHLEVTISALNLKLFDGDALVLDAPVAVGTGSRPTLPGLHFLNVLIKVPDDPKSQFYGPYAFGLSAYSDDPAVQAEFDGGQLGIHGTNDPASIGQAVSNGCIRLSNEHISMLASTLPLGTPVVIKA